MSLYTDHLLYKRTCPSDYQAVLADMIHYLIGFHPKLQSVRSVSVHLFLKRRIPPCQLQWSTPGEYIPKSILESC